MAPFVPGRRSRSRPTSMAAGAHSAHPARSAAVGPRRGGEWRREPVRPRSTGGPDVTEDRSGGAGPEATDATTDPAAEGLGEAAARRRADRERVIAHLDLAEGRGPVPLLDDDAIAAVLRATRRIAVVGASSNETRPSFGV